MRRTAQILSEPFRHCAESLGHLSEVLFSNLKTIDPDSAFYAAHSHARLWLEPLASAFERTHLLEGDDDHAVKGRGYVPLRGLND